MKRLNKGLALGLAFAAVFLIAAFVVPALQNMPAIEEPPADNDSALDAQLAQRGYPQDVLDSMLPEDKQDLLDADAYYEGSSCDEYNVPDLPFTWPLDDVQAPDRADDADGWHTIRTSSLSLLLETQKLGENTVVTFYYRWHRQPAGRLEDLILVGWDPDVFYMLENSFQRIDCYRTVFSAERRVHVDETSYATGAPGQIGWYADLKGYTAWTNDLSGAGRFVLVPKVKGQSVKLSALYMHLPVFDSASVGYDPEMDGFVLHNVPLLYSTAQTDIMVTS